MNTKGQDGELENGDGQPSTAERSLQELELKESVFAHEVSQGLFTLQPLIKEARTILEKDVRVVEGREWFELQEIVEEISWEVESQIHQAATLLSHLQGTASLGVQGSRILDISPVEVLKDMISIYKGKAKKKQLRIRDIEERDEFPQLRIDVNAVRRIFHNILSNAIKYSDTGDGDNRFISIQCRRHDIKGMEWAIGVQNYGIGILPDEIRLLGTAGFRGSLAVRQNAFGTGLGLHHVNECLKAHGGRMRVRSERMHGHVYLTTVILIFPRTTSIGRD